MLFTEISIRTALGRMICANRAAPLSLSSHLTINCTFRVRTTTAMIDSASFRPGTMCRFYPSLTVRVIAHCRIWEELLMNIVLWVTLRLRSCRSLLCYLVRFLLLLLLRDLINRLLLDRRLLLFLGFKLKDLFSRYNFWGIHVEIKTADIRAQESIIGLILNQ